MRDTQSENIHSDVHAKKHESTKQIATLGQCLLDSDAETMRLARRNRRKSLALSTLIEAALLMAAIVVPLFASHALPLVLSDPPILVPRGIPLVPVPPEGVIRSTPGPRQPTPVTTIFRPPRIPQGVAFIDDRNDAPTLGTPAGEAFLVGGPDGIAGLDSVFRDLSRRPAPAPVVPESKPRGPVRVSSRVQEAKLLHRVDPNYPPLARQIRKEGRVELQAIIATDGTMRELEVVSGDPLFIQSTLDAVRQWRYRPTMLGSEPVEVQTRITVIFTMRSN